MERYEDKSAMALVPATERTVSFESTAEIVLPEYLGEVGRLLWVRPTVQLPNGFLSAGTAEYAGKMTYHVLFVGTDGRLYGTEQEENYAFNFPCEATGLERISVLPQTDAVIARVLGPRKLSVRCRMRAEVTGYVEKNLAPNDGGSEHLCRLGDVTDGGRFFVIRGEAVELGEEIALDGEAPVQVVFSHAEMYLPDVTARAGEVHCRGEAVVTLVLAPDGGTPYTLVRRLPFDAVLEGDAVSSDANARAYAEVCDLRAVPGENGVALALSFIPVAEVQENAPVVYLKDAFAPGKHTVCRSERARIFCAGMCGNVHFSVTGAVERDACGLPADATVLAVLAEAEVREKHGDKRGITVAGDICGHILYKNGEELGAVGMTVPFSVRTDGEFETLSVRASVPTCRVTARGTQLVLDAELLLALRACNASDVTRVSEIEVTECERAMRADVEIYYPAHGETVWGVAKRYAVSPEALAMANGIGGEPDAMPEGCAYLLIPDFQGEC